MAKTYSSICKVAAGIRETFGAFFSNLKREPWQKERKKGRKKERKKRKEKLRERCQVCLGHRVAVQQSY